MLRPVYRGLMAAVRGLFKGYWQLFSLIFGQRNALRFFHQLSAGLNPVIEVAGIRMDGSAPRPFERATTLLTVEPETILWLDTYYRPGETVYDIGANVGIYTLYAAVRHGARLTLGSLLRSSRPPTADFG